jgi:hypothetical protein
MNKRDVWRAGTRLRKTATPFKRRLARCGAVLACMAAMAIPAHAVGPESDGWITPQPGHDLGIIYLGRDVYTKAYANNQVAGPNARLDADFALLRYTHPIIVGDTVLNPQFIQPLSRLRAGGTLSELGSANGAGDLMLLMGIFPIHDWANRTHFAIVPYLWLPTGAYDKNRALNPGENRWKTAAQVGGQFPVSDSFVVSLTADTTFFGKNKEAFGGGELTQKPLTELRGWLKYDLQSAYYAHWAVGLSHVSGGETSLNGARQSDAKGTTTLMF